MRAFFGLLPLFVHREDMKQDSGIIRNGDQGRNVQTHSIGINYVGYIAHPLGIVRRILGGVRNSRRAGESPVYVFNITTPIDIIAAYSREPVSNEIKSITVASIDLI